MTRRPGFLLLAAVLAGMCGCYSCSMNQLKTTVLPQIPDEAYAKGVSAPFCGIIGNTLIVGGGANFPEAPLLEGGRKRVYRDIWALGADGWARIGLLPDSTAYGATFPLGNGLLLAGGNVPGKTTDRVYILSPDGSISEAPSLPFPVEQAGAASDGGELFLVGGQGKDGGLRSVLRYSGGGWEEIATLPEPLVQPVAFASGGRLYVWGGFNPETLLAPSEGLSLDLQTLSWSPAPAIPDGGTFTGSSGAVLGDGRLAVVGGVNKEIFERALRNTPEDRIPYLSKEPEQYKFRKVVYVFDPRKGEWFSKGETPYAALAGPGAAAVGNVLYVSGGELKPGVRSPRSFKTELK